MATSVEGKGSNALIFAFLSSSVLYVIAALVRIAVIVGLIFHALATTWVLGNGILGGFAALNSVIVILFVAFGPFGPKCSKCSSRWTWGKNTCFSCGK